MTKREPDYNRETGRWYWRLANKGLSINTVMLCNGVLVPWDLYWLMPGSLGAYTAEYETREAAHAALGEAVRRYDADEREEVWHADRNKMPQT